MKTFMEVFSFVVAVITILAGLAAVGGLFFWLALTANGANPFR